MSFREFIAGELVDVIEWNDESGDTMVSRFSRPDNEIKNGAQLIVRPGQIAMLVDQAEQFDHGAGRELRAFVLVEPDHLAVEAQVEAQLAQGGAREATRLHGPGATRAIHLLAHAYGASARALRPLTPAFGSFHAGSHAKPSASHTTAAAPRAIASAMNLRPSAASPG